MWNVQPVVFNSDEGIFARKTWSAECVYWSQDTFTYLTHNATVQSVCFAERDVRVACIRLTLTLIYKVGLKDGNRIFVTGDRGHSTTLHEDDIDVRQLAFCRSWFTY